MRYLPHTSEDRKEMLAKVGVTSIDELYKHAPTSCKLKDLPNLPLTKSEMQVERILSSIASKNHKTSDGPFFLGAGAYNHHVPSTVDYIIQRSEFLTAYTPYQPEVSQGTLMTIFEFQQMVAAITGMEVSNASMYDGSTSMAEAALMARRIKKKDIVRTINGIHPQYMEVLNTYMQFNEGKIIEHDFSDLENQENLDKIAEEKNTSCVIVQYPDFYGNIPDLNKIKEACDKIGALMIVTITEIVSLGLLEAPSMADIVVAEGQSLGNALSYGGPYIGLFACKKQYVRQMPGRLCGETVDAAGRRSYVLTLNTREQHIRRDKATSNICTNQGLCATAFTVHLSLLGEEGFKDLALINHNRAVALAESLNNIEQVTVLNETFFNEFTIKINSKKHINTIIKELSDKNIIAGLAAGKDKLIVAATEVTTDEDIEIFTSELAKICKG